ncbi:origin recognition complex subunit 3 N-terminus-domain-containing protein [Paraphysoderma sedebokerense]|nr:origin recognition complex subunit 3 N-terminus-domain-containing protein [Paraphysoderma sedebokerense]
MGFQALHNEPETLRNLRFQLFESSLDSITSIIEETQSTINLSLIQNVVQFVESASKILMEPGNVDNSRPFLNRREIMTGLIFTGVNSHDHISTYDALVGSIARETRHKVAVLVPKNCTTIKNAVKRVVQQFVDETSEGWDSDEDEEAMSSRKIRKVPNYDMQGLLGWYQSSRREYTKEEETSQKGVPSLVLFIQDFELCDSRVLEQLIGVCCSYKDRLPIVLLFGIATSMETFHQVLSAGTISRLSTQNFKLQSPAECVESIIEKVFIQRKSGWKLGGDVLHTLLHRFWNYNSSVAELSRSIHLALLHFFYSNPLSIFCSPNTDIGANFDDAWNYINTDHLLNLQMCDSFRNHVLTLPAKEIAPLLSDTPNAEMKQFVFDALEGLDRYHERLRAGYECFRQFISLMDNYGKKAFRRFILAIQDGQVAKNDLGRKYIAHKDVKMLFGLFK